LVENPARRIDDRDRRRRFVSPPCGARQGTAQEKFEAFDFGLEVDHFDEWEQGESVNSWSRNVYLKDGNCSTKVVVFAVEFENDTDTVASCGIQS